MALDRSQGHSAVGQNFGQNLGLVFEDEVDQPQED